MCSIVFAYDITDEHEWIIAANRDEKLDRPAEGPSIHHRRNTIWAPRDLQEGGTWFGVNAQGCVAAITNRFGPRRDASRQSRGNLVFDALNHHGAHAASESIRSLDPRDYNPFHLLVADADGAFVVWSDDESMHLETFGTGLHVLTERSFGAAANARADFIEAQARSLVEQDALSPSALAAILSVRRVGDIDATCVLIPEMNYGTRSSAIAAIGRESFFHWAEGAPCDSEYEDLSAEFNRFLEG